MIVTLRVTDCLDTVGRRRATDLFLHGPVSTNDSSSSSKAHTYTYDILLLTRIPMLMVGAGALTIDRPWTELEHTLMQECVCGVYAASGDADAPPRHDQ